MIHEQCYHFCIVIDILQYTLSQDLTEKLEQAQLKYDNERKNNEKTVQAKIDSLNYDVS